MLLFKPSVKCVERGELTLASIRPGQLFMFRCDNENVFQKVSSDVYRPVGWDYEGSTDYDRSTKGALDWRVQRVRITCIEVEDVE